MTEMDSIVDKTLVLDAVELTVADLDRSVEYYTQDIGLRLLARDTGSAGLGVPGRAFVVLRQLPGALPPPSSSAGLSHFAPQVPTPADLARFVRHYARYARFQLIDHVVSRSCYVLDPDGHCVEVTCTRPRNEWRWQNGRPVLVADPLEMRDFSGEPGADLPFDSLPPDTELGHVQLKVTDPGLAVTEPFYCDLLGFEVEARLGPCFSPSGLPPTGSARPGESPHPRTAPGSSASIWCAPPQTTLTSWPAGFPRAPSRGSGV